MYEKLSTFHFWPKFPDMRDVRDEYLTPTTVLTLFADLAASMSVSPLAGLVSAFAIVNALLVLVVMVMRLNRSRCRLNEQECRNS